MFEDAIGRQEHAEDVIDPTRISQAAAMLGLGLELGPDVTSTDAPIYLPPLFHLFFGNNAADAGLLNQDGHEALGRFIPDVTKMGDYHRRMWAAGEMKFQGQLKVGERLKRSSTITKIDPKEGKTGKMIFVTVDRLIETASGQVEETRIIVYRHAATTAAPESIDLAPQDGLKERALWQPDPLQLFRFSALTWNGHRIHYDLRHAQEVEHYPDLITHGPFTAMMLANLTGDGLGFEAAMQHGHGLKRFKFRGTQALYARRQVSLCLSDDGTTAEARNHHGQQAMTATREMA